MRWLAGTALAVAAVVWVISAPAGSQDNRSGSVGLSIVPAIAEKVVSAGQLSLVPITVTNITSGPRAVAVEFRPLAPIDPIIDQSARSRFDASAWLSADETELLLAEGESRAIDIRINPPADAGAGGHYANVVFKALNRPAGEISESPSSFINPELIGVLFLTVPGDIQEVAEADYAAPGWLAQGPELEFTTDIRNFGNVHLLPNVSVEIVRTDGSRVNHLDTGHKLLLPGTSSAYRTEWPQPPPGVYRAKFSVSYGSPARVLEHSSGWFVVLPAIWIQAVLLAFLILLGRFGWRPLWRRLRPKRYKAGYDLTGEPAFRLSNEKIERAADASRLPDSSRKK